jgi:beta-lactamase regulating signal transducer with metallopeptidase domain
MTSLESGILVKATLLIGTGLLATVVMRRQAAALRHAVLLSTLVGAVLLPAVVFVSPSWKVSVPALSPVEQYYPGAEVTTKDEGAVPTHSVSSASAPRFSSPVIETTPSRSGYLIPGAVTLIAIWLAGAIAILAWFTIGLLRLRGVARKSFALSSRDWTDILREEQEIARVSASVRLLSSAAASTPLTWGVWKPVILLPEDASDWDSNHRRVVLRHELAHVARFDSLSQQIAGFACAIYWFNPVVWLAERRLRAECERACDDMVVRAGTPGAVYATHLLEVARSARSFGSPALLSVAMARPTQLEGRLLAVLDDTRRRTPPSRGVRAGIAAAAGVFILTLSAFQPVRAAFHAPGRAATEHVPLAAGPHQGAPAAKTSGPMVSAKSAAPGTALLAADSTFARSFAARSGGTLTLDLMPVGGTITIVGWDRDEVQVTAHLAGRSWRDSEIRITPVGDGVEIRSRYIGKSHNTSFSNSFTIQVPRNYNGRIKSSGGGISITGVNGEFTGSTGGGEIEIDHVKGELRLTTGGGDVNVTNSAVDGSITTGGGEVRITGNSGRLRGASGSGEIYIEPDRGSVSTTGSLGGITAIAAGGTTTFRRGDDPDPSRYFGARGIQRTRSGGDITLAAAQGGARVSTGGGAIRIGASSGDVYASTGGGPIQIGPATGSVIAQTGAGEITVKFTGSNPHSADLTTGNGRIVLVLPENFSATLELESAYTNNLGHHTTIQSDFPLTLTETPDWDASEGTPRRYVRARQTFGGGGGVIRVRSVNGDVVVRREGRTD